MTYIAWLNCHRLPKKKNALPLSRAFFFTPATQEILSYEG